MQQYMLKNLSFLIIKESSIKQVEEIKSPVVSIIKVRLLYEGWYLQV